MEQKKELVIAIDVDGVLRDNLGKMVKIYNKEFKDNKKVEEVRDFKTDISFPRIQAESGKTASQWFFQDHSKELFLDAKPFKNVKKDIKDLQQYGKVIIITYQKSYKNKMQTLQWLERNGIEPDGIVFLKDKTLLNCDILIDDNDWNFIGTKAKHAVLINAPYNEATDLTKLLDSGSAEDIIRVDSLHEFIEIFKKSRAEASA